MWRCAGTGDRGGREEVREVSVGGGERGECDRRSLEITQKEKEKGEHWRKRGKKRREGVHPGWAVHPFT